MGEKAALWWEYFVLNFSTFWKSFPRKYQLGREQAKENSFCHFSNEVSFISRLCFLEQF